MIGAAVRRTEDVRFLTGRGQYVDDLHFPGELHCSMVRSPHAHARIRGIEISEALLPGVAGAFSGLDMQADGVGPMRCGWALPGMAEPSRWALARDVVRHVGEPVAAVFAGSRWLAEDAADCVRVEYEDLPGFEEIGRASCRERV